MKFAEDPRVIQALSLHPILIIMPLLIIIQIRERKSCLNTLTWVPRHRAIRKFTSTRRPIQGSNRSIRSKSMRMEESTMQSAGRPHSMEARKVSKMTRSLAKIIMTTTHQIINKRILTTVRTNLRTPASHPTMREKTTILENSQSTKLPNNKFIIEKALVFTSLIMRELMIKGPKNCQ